MRNKGLPAAALIQLRRHKGRNRGIVAVLSLCMGCMLAMMAMGEGGTAQFEQSLAAADPTRIIVTPGTGAAATLNDAAVASFRRIEGVQSASGVIELKLAVKLGRYGAENLAVTAVDPSVLRGRLPFQAGALFDGQGNSLEIVLGTGARREFAGNASDATPVYDDGQSAAPTAPPVDWLGQGAQVSLAGAGEGAGGEAGEPAAAARTYSGRVCGILMEDSGELDDRAFISLSAARKLIRENREAAGALGLDADAYAVAYVHAHDIDSVKSVKDAVARMGFTAQSAVADLDALQVTLGLQRTVLAVIEIFAVLTALLATVCILLWGRARRGADLSGTATAGLLGARVIVSAAIGLLGGISAVLLACFFALIINTSSTETVVFGMQFGQNSNIAIPMESALLVIGSSPVITLLAGLLVETTCPAQIAI